MLSSTASARPRGAWVPAQLDPANRENRGSHYLNLIARLRSGMPAEQAQRELVGLVQRWEDENPDTHVRRPDVHELFLRPLQEDLIGGIRPALLMLFGAVGFVLVVGSGLMLRSFAALQEVDPGFDTRNLLTFEMFLPASKYQDEPARAAFIECGLQRLGALPGVGAAAAMSGLPPRREVDATDTEFEGYTPTEDGPRNNTDYWQFVTTDYFEAMRIPLLAGRTFGPQDGPEAGPVVMVNETLAKLYYPDGDPIGSACARRSATTRGTRSSAL